jgi:undecaprenyl-diphosphatase
MKHDQIFLSVFQGIAEFLPISSNGHLLVFEKVLGITSHGFETHVILHFGSLLALVLFFIKDLFLMLMGFWVCEVRNLRKHPLREYRDKAVFLIIASIPAVIVGFIVKKYFGKTSESFKIIGIASIVFGILLIIADSNPVKDRYVTYKSSFIMGIAQCLAFILGASRSGMCLTGARLCGLNRIEATRFSFLMAIPTILGATVLVLKDIHNIKMLFVGPQLVLIAITAGFGLLTIQLLLWFLSRFSFFIFGLYRIVFGILILYFL